MGRLRDSVQHQQELRLARTYRIPRSRLLGREPRTVTTYHYDGEGRLVRAVTVRESEWTEDDRDWALADLQVQDGLCGSCGLPLEETTDPDNEFAYVADEPARCHACVPVNRSKRSREDPSDGWIFRVRKVR